MNTDIEKGINTKEVYFEIILPKSSFLNYRLGVTKSVSPGISVLDVWDVACSEAEEWHKRKHPELYKHNEAVLTVEETSLLEDIKNATDVKKLGMLKNHLTPALKPYYVEKLKTLTDNFKTHD
jgi:hypothetical protein